MTDRTTANTAAEPSNSSFKAAYGVLQRHAETLREQDEPNIDDLLTIVTESVAAYKVCKDRIDAVEAALKAALDGVGVGAAPGGQGMWPSDEASAAPAKPPVSRRSARMPPAPSPSPSAVDDDDIPF